MLDAIHPKAEYQRIQDKATFKIRREANGSYTVTCQVGDPEKYGWPAPAPVAAVEGLPDEATAETIIVRLRQMDIDAHAQYLFQFQPKPAPEPAPAEEPSFKKEGRE